MLQAVMPQPGKVDIREVDVPKAGSGEVLLRIQRIGVCGSDIHVFHGLHPLTSYPVVQGHEFSAIVESVGEGVIGLEPGAKVTALPQIVCGKCAACRSGNEHICHELKVQGFQAPGCAQELWVTSAANIVKLPEAMDLDNGALVEPTSVGVHAINRIDNITQRRVLVIGAGPIGNLLAQAAVASGAKKVALVDVNQGRLDIAKACGMEFVINSMTEDFVEGVKRVFGAEGYDVVFDCAGVEPALTPAIANLQKGGVVMIVAVYSKPAKVDLTLVQDRELSIVGTLMYQRPDYEKAIEFLSDGSINTKPLITKRFNLVDYAAAYDFVEKHSSETMKVIIDVSTNS